MCGRGLLQELSCEHVPEATPSTLDPDTGEIHVYRNGVFEPNAPWADTIPEVPNSLDWYRGTREHLKVARIASSVVSA